MIIELPGLDFERPHSNATAIEPLFDKVRQVLDAKGTNRNEYVLDNQLTTGFDQLVIQKANYS